MNPELLMRLQKIVIPGLTRNLGSCESVEFTLMPDQVRNDEIKNRTFCIGTKT